jgi:Helix-turn-helix domain
MASGRRSAAYDRIVERRRAAALARHFREAEGLSIAQIAERLGRSPATIKAYFFDPTDANKGLSRERVAKAGGREVWSHLPAAAARGEILPWPTFLCARLGCPARPVLGF